jgi:hypothetical protein
MSSEIASVLIATVTTVPAILAAVASMRVHREVRTNHGKRNGEYVEELAAWAQHHTEQDAENFAELRAALGMPPKPYWARPLTEER